MTWLLWSRRRISSWAFTEPMCIYLCSTLLGLPVGQLGWMILAMTLLISMVGLMTANFHWALQIYQARVITNTVLATILWIRWSFFTSVLAYQNKSKLAVLACWSMARSFRLLGHHFSSEEYSKWLLPSLAHFMGCLEINAEQCKHFVNHIVHE